MSVDWTIADLAARAAEALRAGDARAGTPNGRVRDLPSERVIRWYTTIGLLDPPLSRRGRVARYGRRHLLQLVAIKRRQAAGHSLAEIQGELLGATNAALEAAAHLPAPADDVPDLPAPPAVVPGGATTPPDRPGAASDPSVARFWTRPHRAGGAPEGRDTAVAGAVDPPTAAGSVPGFGAVPAVAGAADSPAGSVGVPLAPGVTLLLDGAPRRPTATDVTALVSAATTLLAAARDRGLVPGDTGSPTSKGAAQ